MIHSFTIPNWRPVLLNALLREVPIVRWKLKKADREIVAAYACQASIPKATGMRRVSITVRFTQNHFADRDAYDKSLLDALVVCGLLKNDDPRYLQGRMEVRFEKAKTKSTTITLEDVEK